MLCKEVIYINEMAVLPERQGLGIGKQLLNAVNIASDRRMGNLQVYIWINLNLASCFCEGRAARERLKCNMHTK